MGPGADPSSNPSIFQFPNMPSDPRSSGMADIKPQIESQTGVPKPKPFAPAGHSMYPAATVAMPVHVCIFTCAILMCTYKYSVLHVLLCLRIEKVLRTILPQQQWLAARMISVIVLQLPRNAEKIRAALLHSHKCRMFNPPYPNSSIYYYTCSQAFFFSLFNQKNQLYSQIYIFKLHRIFISEFFIHIPSDFYLTR